jgi:hypothetical protein
MAKNRTPGEDVAHFAARAYRAEHSDGAFDKPLIRRDEMTLYQRLFRDKAWDQVAALTRTQVRTKPQRNTERLREFVARGEQPSRSEDRIGLAAGAWLGGMLSLAKSCRFPMLLLVTMRGEWAEFNPWQVPMGTTTQAALELMDALVYRVERPEDAVGTVKAAIEIAFAGDHVAAVLLAQRLIGAKRWVE